MQTDKPTISPSIISEMRAKHRRLRFFSKKALRIKKKQFPRSMRRYVIK